MPKPEGSWRFRGTEGRHHDPYQALGTWVYPDGGTPPTTREASQLPKTGSGRSMLETRGREKRDVQPWEGQPWHQVSRGRSQEMHRNKGTNEDGEKRKLHLWNSAKV